MFLLQKTFKRLHYPVDIITPCVCRYLAYALSQRNLEQMIAERRIEVDPATLHRCVVRLVPLDKSGTNKAAQIASMWANQGKNAFRQAHMIRKQQLQHPEGDKLSPTEQFYLLAR